MKRNKLREPRCKELSVVRRGANPGAIAVLAKRHPDDTTEARGVIAAIAKLFGVDLQGGLTPESVAKLSQPRTDVEKAAKSFAALLGQERLWPLLSALGEAIRSTLQDTELDGPAVKAKLSEISEQFTTELLALPGVGAKAAEVGKSDPDPGAEGEPTDRTLAAGANTTEEHDMDPVTKAALEKAEADRVAQAATVAKMLEAVESLTATVAKQTEAIEAQKATIATLEKGAAEREQVAVAKALIGDAPLDATAIAKTRAALPEADRAAFDELMKSTAAVHAAGDVFKQFGSAVADLTPEGNTLIEKRANEIRAAEPHLSAEQAIAKALDENPAAYEAATAGEG